MRDSAQGVSTASPSPTPIRAMNMPTADSTKAQAAVITHQMKMPSATRRVRRTRSASRPNTRPKSRKKVANAGGPTHAIWKSLKPRSRRTGSISNDRICRSMNDST